MIRTCPHCGAFYAHPTLAFCVADGAPLVGVDPGTDKWGEAKRYFEKTQENRKQLERKTKRRRLLFTTATALVIAMVVLVVTVNGLILLEVLPKEPAATPTPSTPIAVANPVPTTDIQPRPGGRAPESTPTPSPTSSPTPTATPTPVPSPKVTPTVPPVVPSTPPVTPVLAETPRPPSCSAADRERENRAITERYAEKWSAAARAAPPPPPPGLMPRAETEVVLNGAEYLPNILGDCVVASVNALFIWQLRQSYNGTTKLSTFTTQKTYTCAKNGAAWICH